MLTTLALCLFAPQHTLGSGLLQTTDQGYARPRRHTVACDLDGDGDLDLAWLKNAVGHVGWALNGGRGASVGMRELGSYTAADDPQGFLAAVDADGDGDLDLIDAMDAGPGSDCGWYEQTEIGRFAQRAPLPGAPNTVHALRALDVDGDGRDDLVLAKRGVALAWMRNVGSAGLAPAVDLVSVSARPRFLDVADLDGDGLRDLVWTEAGGSAESVAWSRAIGNGAFGPRQLLGDSGAILQSLDTGDVDGDGDVDVVMAAIPAGILCFTNGGAGAFGAPHALSTPFQGAFDARLVDLDSDGALDMVAAEPLGKLVIYRGDGQGAFSVLAARGDLSLYAREVTVGADDLDGDGDLDPWIAGHRLLWVPDVDSTTASAARSFHPSERAWALPAIGELGVDGARVAFISTEAGPLRLARLGQARQSTEGLPNALAAGGRIVSRPLLHDFDGDGAEDLLVTYFAGPSFGDHFVALQRHQAAPEVIAGPLSGYQPLARAGDANGDGRLDVFVHREPVGTDLGTGQWLLQSQAGSFVPQAPRTEPYWHLHDVGDVDGDGRADVLAAADPVVGSVDLFWHGTLPDGSLAPRTPIATVPTHWDSHFDAEWADLDDDGHLDLVLFDRGVGIVAARGLGGGAFAPVETLVPETSGERRAYEIADYDGDGVLDAILELPGRFDLHVGDGSGGFGPRVPLLSGDFFVDVSSSIAAMDVDGDALLDIVASTGTGLRIHFARERVGYGFCEFSAVGSNGARPRMWATGSANVAENDFTLRADRLPPGAFGQFLLSAGLEPTPQPLLDGTLCIGGSAPIGRFGTQGIQQASAAGTVEFQVDLTQVPTGGVGFEALAPGDTRTFQYWTRDVIGGSTANLTNALGVLFR